MLYERELRFRQESTEFWPNLRLLIDYLKGVWCFVLRGMTDRDDDRLGAAESDEQIVMDRGIAEKLQELVSELTTSRSQIDHVAEDIDSRELTSAIQQLDLITTQLVECVTQMQHTSVAEALGDLPQLLEEWMEGLTPSVTIEGGQTPIDHKAAAALEGAAKALLERLAVNRVAESPGGRPSSLDLEVDARQDGAQISVEISERATSDDKK